MEIAETEKLENLKKIMSNMEFFTKLNPDANNNSLSVPIKLSSYYELNLMVSSLLKTSISLLKNDISSGIAIDLIILLEIVLQLLPEDEMELLDKIREIDKR
ncbi:hypothetical protein [Flavobacterium sp. AJR]|uniref:hypothetical protein n=1 Tax=Flavobacterium sp. AJR TaxID=1979369 RepID=UPI000A3D6CCE|nr:hypothetical protein [Flavobacterium sp. AJR]OUL60391.1 hypothetical protein B8T70_20695 [Flavobacterium sp. AJR]